MTIVFHRLDKNRRNSNESIAHCSRMRTARSPDSQMNQSAQPGTDTWMGFPNAKMPSKHGLPCAPNLEGNLTTLKRVYCTKVECPPAIAQRPQLSLKSTGRSAVARVIRKPGKLSSISDELSHPHVSPRGSGSKRPSPPVIFSRR